MDFRGGDLADIVPFILQAEAATWRLQLPSGARLSWPQWRSEAGCIHAIVVKTSMLFTEASILVEAWKAANQYILEDFKNLISTSQGANYFL